MERAVKRTERRTGEKVPQDPDTHIQNYLDRLGRLTLDPEKKQKRKNFEAEPRPRALSILREIVMNKYVRPHKEKMAEGAARVEERAARELGIEAHYGEHELGQRGEISVEDLEKSLDNWISYLSNANEPYPMWFRYYVFRNVLDLGDYDKDKGEFTKRSQGSTRLFPDKDSGALAYIQQMIEAARDPKLLERLQKAQKETGALEDQLITKEKAAQFTKLSFAKQYAEGIKQRGEITPEMREETRGRWVKYQKETDPTALWASLQNKGVAWCTKGFATAETQLKGGDFYVYYTNDKQGKPTIPRIAIRMQKETIAEVRGVTDNNQNLEGTMAAIAEEKMKELPGADKYKKASADMKQLTRIERKTVKKEALTKDELVFLYEISASIEGFGYQRDPRIAELRSQRNPEEDMPIIFECTKDQIARSPSEIREDTSAYVGKLAPGIFDAIQQYNIEHIYTSFPENRIFKDGVKIGYNPENLPPDLKKIKDKVKLQESLKDKLIQSLNETEIGGVPSNITSYVKEDMIRNDGFKIQEGEERVIFVRLKVSDLGFPKGKYPTIDEIYKRAEELGIELCPAEIGPHYRLRYKDQPLGEWLKIGMRQFSDRDGFLVIFLLLRNENGLWLIDDWAYPTDGWNPNSKFVFRLRKLRNLKT